MEGYVLLHPDVQNTECFIGQENVGIPVDQRDLSKPRHRCMSSCASLQSILRYLTSSCRSALEERREESEDDVQGVL